MPPRGKAAPRGESRTGLIVALVFFILTTITLGVVAYMGYDGQKELEEKAKLAAEDSKKANDAMNEANAKSLACDVMMGMVPANKAGDLGMLNANENFRKKLADIRAFFQAYGVDWDDKAATPTLSIMGALKDLTEKRATDNKNMLASLQVAEKAATDYASLSATEKQKATTALAENQIAQDRSLEYQKQANEAKKTAVDQLNSLSEQLKKAKEESTNAIATLSSEKKKLEEDITAAREVLEKLKRDQDARRAQLLLTDRVVGHVKRVDGVAGTAYIDLGSADYVRPGMTFSILMKYDASKYSIDDPLPKKATLVVNQVVTAHSSRTTIEFDPQVNPIQDPVEVGDGLYKPGWKPGTPVRWALAGHFDLNGLGRDETQLLKNRLEKEGIVVDAYLDLNTLKVVGELNHSIDYLIVGSRPTGETARIIGEQRKKQIEDAMADMIKSAQGMGITVMQGRVFLPVFGIDLPRNRALPLFPGGGAGGARGGDEPDSGEKKGDGK